MQKLTFTALVLMLVLNVSLARAENPASLTLPSYELYSPAKVVISYIYTNNVSVQVNTLGASLYQVTTTPVSTVFEASAYDVYTITVQISYLDITNQTIVIGLLEGGRPAKGIEMPVSTNTVIFTFRISVVEAPRYPSAEEIANVLMDKLRNELADYTAHIDALIKQLSESLTFAASLSIIAFAIAIVVLVANYYLHRKVSELTEWGIRHESEHRKEAS